MIGSAQKVMSNYNGKPCYEVTQTAETVSGCCGVGNSAASFDNIPSCVSLRNAAMLTATSQNTAGSFDPVQWLKDNKLTAAGAAIAVYFLFFKK